MNTDSIEIVAPAESHRAAWRRLYDGYAAFYKREMTDEIADNVWQWLQDPAITFVMIDEIRDPRILYGIDVHRVQGVEEQCLVEGRDQHRRETHFQHALFPIRFGMRWGNQDKRQIL